MNTTLSDNATTVERLQALSQFSGPPEAFWPQFLEGVTHLAGARAALLTVQSADGAAWRNLSLWPTDQRNAIRDSGFGAQVEQLASNVLAKGHFWQKSDAAPAVPESISRAFAIEIETDEKAPHCVLILFFSGSALSCDQAALEAQIQFATAIPSTYQLGRTVHQIRNDTSQFAEALDLMVLINDQKKYMGAAMTLCNELSSRYQCSRTSLGWIEDNYVRVQAISHIEKFQKKMDAVQSLEAAMEEAFDQDEEVLWPQPEGSSAVTREHENFSKEQGGAFVLSLPIRVDNEPVGVLMCERQENGFSEEEIRGLRVHCDQTARRLADLKKSDRWIGARFAGWGREQLSAFLGPKHTFYKALGIVLCLALMFLLFGRLSYRVEAPFILKSDDLAYIPAPFEGYIDKVNIEVGDFVEKGAVLLALDIQELLLEESTAIANQNRYSREAEKARAQNALADMNISLALKAQAEAQLKQVRYHLNNAELKAPFAGIVVEGDLKELLGAPVRKGDVLFKVAKLENMYVELEVDERDVHEVSAGNTGEIAFVSRPNLKFPMTVSRVDPVAVAKEKGNVFLLRCAFTDKVNDWWRPGMSGVSKVNVGKRNVFWILTHRTVDFFRILLWW
jgi:biotin carboxyl carrier protein